MWARIVECVLAIWLFLSPCIFDYSATDSFLWVSAFLIALFALLSFWPRCKNIHLLSLGVVLWLWGSGYRSFPLPPSAAEENSVAVGLFLLMLAIVPSHSFRFSKSWKDFLSNRTRN